MAKLLDVVIINDVETTCWEGKQASDQDSEIIEIGISLMDIKVERLLGMIRLSSSLKIQK